MKKKSTSGTKLSPARRAELLGILKGRFEKNVSRHRGIRWDAVQARLEANVDKLWSLDEMETSGGEPDVVGHDTKTGEYIFYDCSAQSPKGRRSVCYDHEALRSRKEHKPKNSAIGMATAMGIELLTEEQYRQLQQLGEFDTTTSSWVKTPSDVRELGGALERLARELGREPAEGWAKARDERRTARVRRRRQPIARPSRARVSAAC